ncbi:MAG: hypothetical protein ACI4S2_05435 [Lachnospiraceae bacterium]
MPDLTFGEQVKIVLSRKGMTIKELAEEIEERTGKKMSRQNLTQRLGRDNFQEQDMRMIASILKCPFQLSILGDEIIEDTPAERIILKETEDPTGKEPEEESIEENKMPSERGMTVGEFLERQEEMDESSSDILLKEVLAEMDAIERENKEREKAPRHRYESEEPEKKKSGWMSHLKFRRREEKEEDNTSYFDDEEESSNIDEEGIIDTGEFDSDEKIPEELPRQMPVKETETMKEEVREEAEEENREIGDINPYTGREYATNSVRMHPKRIGYVQVYDRKTHKWTDMTEWAFLGYQERKKVLLGKDYEPPVYLD